LYVVATVSAVVIILLLLLFIIIIIVIFVVVIVVVVVVVVVAVVVVVFSPSQFVIRSTLVHDPFLEVSEVAELTFKGLVDDMSMESRYIIFFVVYFSIYM
jgi:hypothetical protein